MRVTRLLAPALAILALAGGTTAIAFSQTPSQHVAQSASRSRRLIPGVFVAARACTGHVRRPKKIVLACADAGLFASNISWRSYGGSVASGKALIHVNGCNPTCVEGHFHTFHSPIVLRRIVLCSDGRRYYSRARFKGLISDKRWATEYIKPPLRCHLQR